MTRAAQAFRDRDALFEAQQSEPWKNQPTGTPEDVYEWLARYVELGYHHLVFYWPAPVRRGVDGRAWPPRSAPG